MKFMKTVLITLNLIQYLIYYLYDISDLFAFSDSAHRIHPMAGQGANLGFGDVICLADVLEEAIMNGSDIGRYLIIQ